MAAARMGSRAPGQTIQPTALVHEAWIRLSAHQTRQWWDDRKKLFAAAAVTMRRILIDRARRRGDTRLPDSPIRVSMDAANDVHVNPDERILLVHEILDRLESDNPSYARVVILKVFGGLSFAEIAEEMESSERTVYRLWKRAKARIYDEFTHQS